jgi:predicted O-methyltransferase YrrM
MNARGRWRRFALGLPTIAGIARRGFFIPYRYADSLPDAAALPGYAAAENLFAAHRTAFESVIADLATYRDAFASIVADRKPGAARFDQDWFPTLDAAIAYRMVRARRPPRIVEIGSGHSTRFMARAIADGGLATMLTAIDPAPRAAIRRLAIEHVAATVPQTGLEPFSRLQSGDMLFVDSSHILMPGSDVDFILNRVLPSLPSGVVVHIHDIMLPDPYPATWDWYGYNEQHAVMPLLTGGAWRPLFASHYAATRMAGSVAASAIAGLPAAAVAHPASLWLVRGQDDPVAAIRPAD